MKPRYSNKTSKLPSYMSKIHSRMGQDTIGEHQLKDLKYSRIQFLNPKTSFKLKMKRKPLK